MHPMLNTATKAARAGANIILRFADQIETLSIKSKQRNDFVSEIDREVEKIIVEQLRKAYPDHQIEAEESGVSGKNSRYLWIIDPLDGTTNYLYGIPQYAISIALLVDGVPDQAVVYDPAKEELFTASRGVGAWLNSRRIRVSERQSMNAALLGTGIPFRQDQDLSRWIRELEAVAQDTAGIRRAGAASLDMAWVAAGRLDGFWERGLKRWDFAAGVLLVQEAGGLTTDIEATSPDSYWKSGNILCGTPRVHRLMAERLNKLSG